MTKQLPVRDRWFIEMGSGPDYQHNDTAQFSSKARFDMHISAYRNHFENETISYYRAFKTSGIINETPTVTLIEAQHRVFKPKIELNHLMKEARPLRAKTPA